MKIYFGLAGRGSVTVDGEAVNVGAETALYIPGGSEHAIRNDGNKLLRFFYVFAVDRNEDVNYTFS